MLFTCAVLLRWFALSWCGQGGAVHGGTTLSKVGWLRLAFHGGLFRAGNWLLLSHEAHFIEALAACPSAPLVTTCCLPLATHRRGQTTPYQPAISPEPVAHLAQHRLLPLLVDAALKEPAIDLRMGHRCVLVPFMHLHVHVNQCSCWLTPLKEPAIDLRMGDRCGFVGGLQ